MNDWPSLFDSVQGYVNRPLSFGKYGLLIHEKYTQIYGYIYITLKEFESRTFFIGLFNS